MAYLSKDRVKEIIEKAPKGSDPEAILNALQRRGHTIEGLGEEPQTEGVLSRTIKDIPSDIVETGKALGKGILDQGTRIRQEVIDNPNLTLPQKAVGVLGGLFESGAQAIGTVTTGAGKLALTPEAEKSLSDTMAGIGEAAAETDIVKGLANWYDNLDEGNKATLRGVGGFGALVTELAGLKGAGTVTKKAAESGIAGAKAGITSASDIASAAKNTLSTKFGIKAAPTTNIGTEAVAKSFDDVVNTADDYAKQIAQQTGEQTPVSIRESMIGLTPDVKKRITGKPQLMEDYINVTQARNIDDTALSVQEFAGQRVHDAVKNMQSQLDDTGGEIGKFREEFAKTLTAKPEQISQIENKFTDELGKLNLHIVEVDGKNVIEQIPNTVKKYGSNADLAFFNDTLNQLETVKANPTLQNILDFRNFAGNKADFGKMSRELSNSVDAPAKSLRYSAKEVAGNVAGPEHSAQLAKYADLIEAVDQARFFTDKQAGAEYLLRVALSGRGSITRDVIKTIKDFTGVDLMDDATMMKLMIENIANKNQKNLFVQEITSAGLDAAKILKGDVSGIAERAIEGIGKKIAEPTSVLREAAK